ncbi:MAG: GNAT family N-acetyltransferase [Rickettsiales bacterium]|nr:GNAT family N-acetyltransferase [Rickettsiales bacterium]
MTSEITQKIIIKNFDRLDEILQSYPIIRQRYKNLSAENFAAQVKQMIELDNFKMVGAFLDDKIIGVAGYSISHMLYCGRYLQISSFIVDEKSRGLGVGKKILSEVEKIAKELACEKLVLESYSENKKSHALYFRENFYIRGFHFMKDL